MSDMTFVIMSRCQQVRVKLWPDWHSTSEWSASSLLSIPSLALATDKKYKNMKMKYRDV